MEPESEEIFFLNTIYHNDNNNNNNDSNNHNTESSASCSSTPGNNNNNNNNNQRRKGPIHVPLSATCCPQGEEEVPCTTNDSGKHLQSPSVFHDSNITTTTTPTTVCSQEEDAADSFLTASGNLFSSAAAAAAAAAAGASPVDFLGLPSWLCNNNNNNDDDGPTTAGTTSDSAGQESAAANTTATTTSAATSIDTTPERHRYHNRHHHQQEQEAFRTPESARGIRKISSSSLYRHCHHQTMIPQTPVTPDAGCCTACQVYSTGKRPCPTCGTKYCSESRCQDYLYDDGSCAKCCTRPRKPPALPINKDAGCCTSCQQFAIGKDPCKSCGAKYCKEIACQTYLFDDGTCVVCHGNI